MVIFFNIPEKGCIFGRAIPPLSIRMGIAGRLDPSIPGFGLISGENRSCTVQLRPPRFLVGVSPLPISNLKSWSSRVARLWLGCVVFGSTTTQAQTYYYYPSSATYSPVTPRYYWPSGYERDSGWAVYPNQYYQTTYAPQYYQPSYAPQYYQP